MNDGSLGHILPASIESIDILAIQRRRKVHFPGGTDRNASQRILPV